MFVTIVSCFVVSSVVLFAIALVNYFFFTKTPAPTLATVTPPLVFTAHKKSKVAKKRAAAKAAK